MLFPRSIRDNLQFLCVEVDAQVGHLQTYIDRPSGAVSRRILDRGGYAYNLKLRIHSSCVDRMAGNTPRGDADTLALRSIEFIATELDKIAELCRDCIRQLNQLEDPDCVDPQACQPMLGRVRRGIRLVEPAIEKHDSQLALKITQLAGKLSRDYDTLMKDYIAALKLRDNTEDLTRALFVAHDIEQMGNALLDIGEALLSVNLGQPVDLERYYSLRASVEQLDGEDAISDLQIEPIAQTRSGSSVSGITAGDSKDDAYIAIYKDGEKRKLKEERQGVESWHEIYPGLAPKILSYKKRGQSAALLIEHLPGLTFEQVLLHEPVGRLQETLDQLGKTLRSVWRETHTDKTVAAQFMRQLQQRLGDVYRIHPEFQQPKSQIGGLDIPCFDALVEQAAESEAAYPAPFAVYIHGDFNVDNIIYDPLEKRINFIDLHRSRYMDYVQDVSVFMVSNYRLQILDVPLRRRIMQLAQDFYWIARGYADRRSDETFDLRLALGLARSFATSTRFILDKSLARSMFLRARYLIEQVLAVSPGRAGSYRLPLQEIFVG
jgi:aminoglycoside phosphotransferase (APT) family kinase protein/phosphate uptake regulator